MSQPLPSRIGDAAALLLGQHTVRCPHPGCTVRIRYRAVTADEAKRLTALATDHTRHGPEQQST
ncbi:MULTISPECIES: hypothetical protein [Streptomyces]|uniref:hypothetical protein n=1 Tax=Streptomyces TaxID=1883 RepID=UPI0016725C99|nr:MULTISPECIES: hypothetical protein [Streptomyces]MBD3578382.1 hypothetical protein [Streptomyces sp. KD18]GGT10974.1 hypothetical protein GCM10010286_40700 [Streptomyces toxytricini]